MSVCWVPNFNSIKVRLEQGKSDKRETIVLGFQFHKGTIRTLDSFKSYINYHISIP